MGKNQTGFSLVEGLLVLVILCFLVIVGWVVWQQLHNKTATINSFDACVAAGNPIMETYPEQCSANGRSFTNPRQANQEPPATISQGVRGTITLRSGDCMPSIGPYNSSCKLETYTTPSKVIIKKPTDPDDKEHKEVVKIIDNVKGTFEAELQPGPYNMYVVYNGEEYCNAFGGQRGEDCEFTVTANEVTDYTLQINIATD